MKIISGLLDNMVLQRDRRNLSHARFIGESEYDGVLLVRVKNGKALKIGTCRNGLFIGILTGLKTGGPYEIELFIKDRQGRILDKAKISNVLVGDVWILGGQSNMEGIGYLKYALKPQNKVRAFYMDDRWDVARDPIHNLNKAVDQVHADLAGGKPPVRPPHVGVGPGVAFGQEMFRRTGVPQGLISCAHGGTSMSQWDPALKAKGGRSLYGALLRRFHKNGGRVAGAVWYQGCSDANEQHVHYTRRMIALVKAMRRDFNAPRLPMAMVQIAGVYSSGWPPARWNSIQEQQRLLPQKIGDLNVTPAIDLSFDDSIHISGFDQARLGKRLAQAMCVLRSEKNAGLPPIELQSITEKLDKKTGARSLFIKFRNVMGGLRSAGKPCGFYVLAGGSVVPSIFRTDIEKDTVILRLLLPSMPESLSVHYGYGLAPYCNITDSADRSLPVFGPELLGYYHGLGKFMVDWLVSATQPSAGRLDTLAYPKDQAALQLKPRSFAKEPNHFCDLHLDLFKCGADDILVYFANWFNCAEPMRLELRLGYDGPIKVWIDGKQVMHDPDGTNPAVADKAVIPFKASRGRHELIIALGSNHGRAWGLFARFRRKDIPPHLLKLGPAYYKLPEALLLNQRTATKKR